MRNLIATLTLISSGVVGATPIKETVVPLKSANDECSAVQKMLDDAHIDVTAKLPQREAELIRVLAHKIASAFKAKGQPILLVLDGKTYLVDPKEYNKNPALKSLPEYAREKQPFVVEGKSDENFYVQTVFVAPNIHQRWRGAFGRPANSLGDNPAWMGFAISEVSESIHSKNQQEVL